MFSGVLLYDKVGGCLCILAAGRGDNIIAFFFFFFF